MTFTAGPVALHDLTARSFCLGHYPLQELPAVLDFLGEGRPRHELDPGNYCLTIDNEDFSPKNSRQELCSIFGELNRFGITIEIGIKSGRP